ncbi:NlpC/P60 family protein [Campylobacter upsaliensis]
MKKYIFVIFVIFLLSGCSFLPQSLNFYKPSYSQNATEERLRSASRKWQKTPYVLGGTSRRGADCSGFTQTLMREFGIMLPRTTKTQMASGIKVSKAKLKAGDLVFFKTGRGPNGLHVGVYLSGNEFVHLSTKGGSKIVSLNNTYWKSRYIGARRYIK